MIAIRALSAACSGLPAETVFSTTGPTGALPHAERTTNARRPTAHTIPAHDPTQSRSDPHMSEPSQNDRLTPTHRPSSAPTPVSTLTRTRHRTSTPLRRADRRSPTIPSLRRSGRLDLPRCDGQSLVVESLVISVSAVPQIRRSQRPRSEPPADRSPPGRSEPGTVRTRARGAPSTRVRARRAIGCRSSSTAGGVLGNGRDPYFAPWQDVQQLNAYSPVLRAAAVETLIRIEGQCDCLRCDTAMLISNDVFARTWGDRGGPVPEADYRPAPIGVQPRPLGASLRCTGRWSGRCRSSGLICATTSVCTTGLHTIHSSRCGSTCRPTPVTTTA